MQKLVRGIHEFQTSVFRSHRELFAQLAEGQRPEVLFITCSDSRIDPCLFTQTDPGELFIARNAGNLIPPYEPGPTGGEAATIEYAVEVLGVTDIIVCGHSQCGAMDALLHPERLERVPLVASWLRHAAPTRRIVTENYAHLTGDALLTVTVEENVLVQLEHLRTQPAVRDRLAQQRVRLHGWVYKLATGQVFAYDHGTGQFGPIERVEVPRKESGRQVVPDRSI